MKANQLLQRPSNHIKAALIGLPNVGKSTLFNSFCGDHQAEVDDFLFTTTGTMCILNEFKYKMDISTLFVCA
jgi:predicted GTPase